MKTIVQFELINHINIMLILVWVLSFFLGKINIIINLCFFILYFPSKLNLVNVMCPQLGHYNNNYIVIHKWFSQSKTKIINRNLNQIKSNHMTGFFPVQFKIILKKDPDIFNMANGHATNSSERINEWMI